MKEKRTVIEDGEAKADSIIIKDKTYQMHTYSAYDVVYFENKYGVGFFLDMLAKKPTTLLTEIAYRLIDGIEIDYKTIDDFRKALSDNESKKSQIVEKTLAAAGKFFAVKEVEVLPDGGQFQGQTETPSNGKRYFSFTSLFGFFKARNKGVDASGH